MCMRQSEDRSVKFWLVNMNLIALIYSVFMGKPSLMLPDLSAFATMLTLTEKRKI